MKMCQLENGAIVPHSEVLITIQKFENLVNELCSNNFYSFPKRLPVIELDKLTKSSEHVIENKEVENILIFVGLLNAKGVMPDNTRNIIGSGLDYANDKSGFYDPVAKILGDQEQIDL